MLTVLTGELGSTLTCVSRAFVYVSFGNGTVTHDRTMPDGEVVTEWFHAAAKVTVRQQFRRRRYRECSHTKNGVTYRAGRPRASEVCSYAVTPTEPQYPGTRAFLFLHLDDPEQEQPYLTHVGRVEVCTCQAGKCKVEICKHRCVAAELDRLGVFDDADVMVYPEAAAATRTPQPPVSCERRHLRTA